MLQSFKSSSFAKPLTVFCIILTFGTIAYLIIAGEILTYYFSAQMNGDMAELQQKLLESKAAWERVQQGQKAQEDKVKILGKSKKPLDMTLFWESFPAAFPCPYKVERVGQNGDGGKNVCGFSEIKKLPHCVVYSFGVNNEVTFEKMILEQTNCTVRMYDLIKIKNNPKALMKAWAGTGRLTYTQSGIGVEPDNNLKAILTKNGDTFIDILKIDVEGSEWKSLDKAVQDFPDGLPISQLQVEIHVNRQKPAERRPLVQNWWDSLQNAGLRPFFKEPNFKYPSTMWEYSFLSVKHGMFKIEE